MAKTKLTNRLSFLRRLNYHLAVVLAIAATVAGGQIVHANYQDQINSLQSQIDASQKRANELRSQGDSLQNALNVISAEKSAIQNQISLNQAKYDQLQQEITANEQKLDRQRVTLSKTVAQIYANGSTTPIEMLASSKNITDYVSAQSIRNGIRNQLKTAMDEVKTLKEALGKQKQQVADVIAQQQAQREQLAAKEAEQARLVAQTRGEEAAYNGLVADLQQQKAKAEAALAASLSSGSYKVAPAGYVNAGQVVGAVGSTGLSSGPHLHLEVRRGGSVTNPSPYIKTDPIAMPPGYISQRYGNPDPIYRSGYHPGTDYAIASGSPIFAIDSGNMYRGCSDQMLGTTNNAYGYVAIVEHSSGVLSVYAHMSGGPAECNYNTYY